MLESLKAEMNRTFTENGAVTYRSSGSDLLDLFGTIGALRKATDDEIVSRFIRAYAEDADMAMKLLFYARDVRGGLGERRVFRVILRYLAENYPTTVAKNLEYIAEYGRYDDYLVLLGTPAEKDALRLIAGQLKADQEALKKNEAVSLLAKWLPSVNTSSQEARKAARRICAKLGMSEPEYRKTLSALRKQIRIIENNLREKDYSFDYAKQPSRALFKYSAAFYRNDRSRYDQYLNAVSSGKAVLHADHIMPYELVNACLKKESITEEEKNVLNVTWNSMPDYGNDENTLTVIDTSGSMYWGGNPVPASVAMSLGLYFAERNRGAFANHFIEFSARPQLIQIKGQTFFDRLSYVTSFNEVANTNLEAVFDVILKAAVKHQVSPEELPAKLIIISDMEFDSCVNNASETNFRNAKQRFEAYGYRLPQIVFWNVASRRRQQPVTMNEQGVALVSGCTPRLFSMVAKGELSPFAFMMDVLQSERYAKISA